MTKDEKINIVLPEGTKELVIRHGDALPIPPPVKVEVSGLLDAPARFYKARVGTFEEKESHLLVDRDNLKLQLVINEKEKYGSNIVGSLFLSKDIAEFGINEKVFGKKQFTEMLRKNRRHFAKREEYDKIMEQLATFTFSREVNGENFDDKKGNTRLLAEKKLKQNLQTTFTLNVKIYEGMPKLKFDVEILVDVTDADTKFWLESIDLIDLLEQERDKAFKQQLESFELSDIAIIEV